jgi:serine/threonine-protein kinase RsbW
MILRLALDMPEDEIFLRLTRLFGRTLLNHMKVVEEVVDDLELVVGELCSNVVRHASSHDRRFRVVLEYYPDSVCLTVEDHGHGFSFRDVPAVGSLRSDFDGSYRIGGFGLQLVRSLSDHLEFYRVDQNGSVVKAHKTLRYQSVEAAAEAELLNKADGEHATLSLA